MKTLLASLLLVACLHAQSWNGKNYGSATANLNGNGRNYFPMTVDMFCDFETGTNGDALTVTNLNASCHNNSAGTWAILNGPLTGEAVISTSGQFGQINPKTVSGNLYIDSNGTRGMDWLATNQDVNAGTIEFTFSGTVGNTSSAFAWVQNNLPANSSAYIGVLGVFINGGSDFANVMNNNGKVHLETQTNPNGAVDVCFGSCDANGFFTYTQGNIYGFELEFNKYPLVYHVLRIYSCTLVGNRCTVGALLAEQWKLTSSTTPHAATAFRIGPHDEANQSAGTDHIYMDGVAISKSGAVIIP